jgi:hypothetical protein
MIKLKQLLESSARDRLKKRVAGHERSLQIGRVEKKIRSILNSLPPEVKNNALEEMEKSGKELADSFLPAPGDTVEGYRGRLFDGGDDFHQALVALDVDGEPDSFADFGEMLPTFDQFPEIMVQQYNESEIRNHLFKNRAVEYPYEVEVYILMLELFSVYLYETRFFGQKIP